MIEALETTSVRSSFGKFNKHSLNYTAQNRNLKRAYVLVSSLCSKLGNFMNRTTLHLLGGALLPLKPLFALVLLVSFFSLPAETFTIGGKKGWSEVVNRTGITTGRGRYGYESLELDTNQNKLNEYTDLFLDFETPQLQELAGKYKIVQNNTVWTKKAARGKGAALSRSTAGGIVLNGGETSFFGNESPAGSFCIDFWICPSTVENGEVLLNWRSSRNINGVIAYQIINLSFYQNKVMTVFSNIFDGYTENGGELSLLTTKSIVPNTWSRHTISYNSSSGELEYRINGHLECIEFVTDTKHENGTVYPPVMGVSANLELCPHYTGLIDDFCIARTYSDVSLEMEDTVFDMFSQDHYVVQGGRFQSEPILFKEGTILNSVTAEMHIPPQTDIHLYVRGGDDYFNWTENYPEWIQVNSGEKLESVSGMYFQVAADLFPDGGGCHSPSITSVTLDYTLLPDPLPPVKIRAEKGDGSVTLTWSYSIEDTAGGYYIYYGNRPGEYLGRVATEGHSPINVGNINSFTLTGLSNGTIYYFAVAAYSKIDSRITGPLSKEVYARPASR